MARPLSDLIIDFIAELRAGGVRISVAESLDAMRAIGVAGLALPRMREGLRATLIKDESDNVVFETLFTKFFRADAPAGEPGRLSRGAQIGVAGGQRGSSVGAPERPSLEPSAGGQSPTSVPKETTEHLDEPSPGKADAPEPYDSSAQRPDGALPQEEHSAAEGAAEDAGAQATAADTETRSREDHAGTRGLSATLARLRELETVPFANYSALEYDQARDLLALLRQRWQTRLGRRLRCAQRGRLDFRRTLRMSLQHGGVPLERRFRKRRPRHLDLVVLADISGSVNYASRLFLELLAGAARGFRRVHRFVFIDRLAAADFAEGHLVMTPDLDLYARSDFGRVLADLDAHHRPILNHAAVLVVLGDARNNQRPPRPDILRTIAGGCRATIWLNPEPVARWNTGDSAIAAYQREADVVLPCGNLRELQKCLLHLR